ncbi:MAG: helicase [Nitrospirae bacterium]|nr:helicase [Nitrospirota bacterium]
MPEKDSIKQRPITDLTFFTNEPEHSLLDRFKVTIEHNTRFFDVLVGFFRTSGFFNLYKSLEKTEKVRILVGISLNRQAYELMKKANPPSPPFSKGGMGGFFHLSHSEAKDDFKENVISEMENSSDKPEVQEGVEKFIEWIKSGKLEIKVYPHTSIHAKVYIMTFGEGDRDVGRVITGSSNFTEAGFIDNLEFNVELKNRADYDFAIKKFNELWNKSVPVSEDYIETINTKTWLNNSITPYELYLKFLYEYFGEKISRTTEDISSTYLPENFVEYQYQKEAVVDAKSKLEEYGGVFLADVVGLGKTYISALLAQQLSGKHLVIAPPALLDEQNPGSWRNVFNDFGVRGTYYRSIGKLDDIIKEGTDRYTNVFIDEAHRFRTETNISYEMLAQICRGKRVILVSATPLNNTPKDILSQLKLFQKARNCTLPNPKVRDLEKFFNRLYERLKNLDRLEDYDEFIKVTKENAKEIRENILKYLMVRRTRNEIEKYFEDDLKKQGLRFPEVADPVSVFYEFDNVLDKVFTSTIELITKSFKYSRYMPLLYLKPGIRELTQPEELSQENMGKFMKILLVKRLESSFFAFKNTLGRFIGSYEAFIREYDKGRVFVSKKHINKIFEFLEDNDEDAIQRLIDEDKAEEYKSGDFEKNFRDKLENDLKILKQINDMWAEIDYDPKINKFLNLLGSDNILKENKLIVFTESKETADYVVENISKKFGNIVLGFSGRSGAAEKEKVIENFDARARNPRDDYRILITTEVLSEGVSLHRSNVVINYDIPWNPTRVIQRVGRINRVDTKFEKIYAYNFFPTVQAESEIGLKAAAETKINAFIEMLGADAKLLTDGEPIKSHEIFNRLSSKKLLTGEDEEEESELKYLKIIREIRDTNPDLFEKVKRLPKKARTARRIQNVIVRSEATKQSHGSVLTFFRKGKLRKIFLADKKSIEEVDFFRAADILRAEKDTPKESLPKDFYGFLDANKKEFELATADEIRHLTHPGSRSYESRLLQIIKAIKNDKKFTEDDEEYLKKLLKVLEEGSLPKQTAKKLINAANADKIKDPLKLLAIFRSGVPQEFFKEHISESAAETSGPREVILSEYLIC